MPYIEMPEKTDDALIQERDAAEWQESLYQEFIRRTGMDEDAAARLSDDTMHQVLIELDEANDKYEQWSAFVASGPPVHIGTVTRLEDVPDLLPLDQVPF